MESGSDGWPEDAGKDELSTVQGGKDDMSVSPDVALSLSRADQIIDALAKHWHPGEYISIPEAPQSADNMGGKLDLVVLSMWASRGFQIDGVEIKVSYSDWKRELDNPAKADWWFQRVHRFWLAVPEPLAAKVKDDLPVGWGLLSCAASGTRVVVKPQTKRKVEPLSWSTTLGLFRACRGTGLTTLSRARSDGEAEGRRRALAEVERTTGDARLRERCDDLERRIAEFEAASGTKLDRWSAKVTGELAAFALRFNSNPRHIGEALENDAKRLTAMAAEIREVSERMASAASPVDEPTFDDLMASAS